MADKLTDSEVQARLNSSQGWQLINGKVSKTYTFKEYSHGLLFASAAGLLADRMDHHPDMEVGYRKVVVSLSTHSAGGISDLDFQLAGQIDSICS